MNYVDRNRISNFIYRYSIKDTAENFNKLAEVITKRKFYIYRTIFIYRYQLLYSRRRFDGNNC